ncbi:MAG TPA: hypothetical protein VMZ51_01140 [Acidimicrobiales bacterium]|nr:hypothetical protein [Acidimicrobiales bacterium]
MTDLNRREFLLAGAGMVLLAACGKSDEDDPAAVKVTVPDEKPGSGKVNLVVASYVHVAGPDQRIALALLNEEGTGPVTPDGPVQVIIDGHPVVSELHADGSLELPYLLVNHRFDKPGFAAVSTVYKGITAKASLEVLDPAKAKVPLAGQPLPGVPTPTKADGKGVDPICTRDPQCPLHEVSLDTALGEKRPIAVLFATPARCQSRLCGPVLDNLLAHHEAFADRVRFIHVEIYASRSGEDLAPAVKSYGLAQEPFLFLAGADGVVRQRIDNAYDRAEAEQALERLTS